MNTCLTIVKLLRDHSGVGEDFSFHNETSLERDLDLDSLDRIEIAMRVEDTFGIEIPDEDVDKRALGTLGGLTAYVQGKLDARSTRLAQIDSRPPTVNAA
jgi:acyl carrier protein